MRKGFLLNFPPDLHLHTVVVRLNTKSPLELYSLIALVEREKGVVDVQGSASL